MTIAVNIFASTVVHSLMLETGLGKPAEGFKFIGMNRAALFDVPFDDRLKRILPNVRDNAFLSG